ncbi:hypothetical protein ACEWY4_006012 [Coilia grayii]|uniref:Immunoglobulin V-set domain-containing protein n=1 Tax=Coilia grayii TaxID=363190 RepID=A0ABD1KC95_9TELE
MLFSLIVVVSVHQIAGVPESVFRQTAGSITLEFQQHQHLDRNSILMIEWYFEGEKIMTYLPSRDSPTVYTHKDRVEFNNRTFSLELRNLQKSDSGLYRGEVNVGQKNIKTEYRLSVLDPVETPVLSVVSNWSSSDSCNVTLTCRGRDLSLTSTCKSITCSPEERASTCKSITCSPEERASTCKSITCSPEERVYNDSALTLSVRDGVFICNHSNAVSWSNDTMETRPLCPFYTGTHEKGKSSDIAGIQTKD